MPKRQQNEETKPPEVLSPMRKVEIDSVKYFIETKYLPSFLTKKEAATALLLDKGKKPAFVEAVWEELENQNKEFFRAYNIGVALKHQIARFNMLLASQSQAQNAQNPSDNGSTSSARASNTNNIQPSMFPSASGAYHPSPEVQRIPFASSGLTTACAQKCSTSSAQASNTNNVQPSMFPSTLEGQRIPAASSGTVGAPSIGAMHHPRMNGSNGPVRGLGMNAPTVPMQQRRMSRTGRAPGPYMATGARMHSNRMNSGMVRAPGSYGPRTSMPPAQMQQQQQQQQQQPMMNSVFAPGMNAAAGPIQHRAGCPVADNGTGFVGPKTEPSTRVLNGMNIGRGMYAPAPEPVMHSARPSSYQQAVSSSPYDLPPYDPDEQNQLLFHFSERTHRDLMERYAGPPSGAMHCFFPFPQSAAAMDVDGLFDGGFPARMMDGLPNGDFAAEGSANGALAGGEFSERVMNGPGPGPGPGPAPNNTSISSLNHFNASWGETPRMPSCYHQNRRQYDP